MPDLTQKLHLGRVERVVFRELELCWKDAAFEWSSFWSLNECFPEEQIILVERASGDAIGRGREEGLVFLEEAF